MAEVRKGAVKWKGTPTDVVGPEIKVGDKAPTDFSVVATDMSPITGKDMAGQTRIICAVPSLDTPVCDTEMRRFNKAAEELPGVKVYVVSMDLPFAQKRWCGATGSDAIVAASDYKDRTFGSAFGTFAPAKGLEVRAVFVIGKDDVVKHVEYVDDIVNEPSYEKALAAAKAAG